VKITVSRIVMAAAAMTIAVTPHAAAQQAHQHITSTAPPAGLVVKVRDVTQAFQDVREAVKAGYEPFLGCVSGAAQGAMGLHLVNGSLVGDSDVDVNRPEALIYEPHNGDMQLVGVEYIVFASAWDANHQGPPVLGGQVFQFNESPNRFRLPAFYGLHVWAARDNPNGAFADWNPQVSCEGQ
jgi:hypothetical protein